MITIRQYLATDRYVFEQLVRYYYEENKITPPSQDMVLSTIGFYIAFPQCGSIYIFEFENEIVGYSIVSNVWSNRYGKLSYLIDEFYVLKEYRRRKIENNHIEYLIKQEGVYGIGIRAEKNRSISKTILKLLKFYEDKDKLYTRVLIHERIKHEFK
ncbi:MAG TPA: hypothetical protein PLI57_02760 [Spirochaetota bacterium]|nr:hypothetical protein [Spirochaetota bacterium]